MQLLAYSFEPPFRQKDPNRAIPEHNIPCIIDWMSNPTIKTHITIPRILIIHGIIHFLTKGVSFSAVAKYHKTGITTTSLPFTRSIISKITHPYELTICNYISRICCFKYVSIQYKNNHRTFTEQQIIRH